MSTADQKACLRGPGVRCQSARSQPLVEPSIELAILDRDDEPGSDASIRIVGLHSRRSGFAGSFDYGLEGGFDPEWFVPAFVTEKLARLR